MQYLELDIEEYIGEEDKQKQMTLFEETSNADVKKDSEKYTLYAYIIEKINTMVIQKFKRNQ